MDQSSTNFTHIDSSGQASMVDVSARDASVRTAQATGKVLLAKKVVDALLDNSTPKGDVLATARIAAIMGAKQTSTLIPLCHPISLQHIKVDLEIKEYGVSIVAEVKTLDRTGVEMEALTAVSVAALTIIDMTKAMDSYFEISEIQMTSKAGGRNGQWSR